MGQLDLHRLQALLFSSAVGTDPYPRELSAAVANSGRISVEARLDAYRDNVAGAHLNALDSAYPVLREFLGPRYWRQLLQHELRQYGTQSQDIHRYGSFVPELVRAAQTTRRELAEYPYLGDLAELEWLIHRQRFAANEPPFDWHAFRRMSAGEQSGAVLTLAAATALYRSDYAVDSLWRQHRTPSTPAFDIAEPIQCCVHRDTTFAVHLTRLTPQQALRLESLQQGASLADLEAAESDAALLIAELFDWIERGYIAGFRAPRDV